MAKVPVDLDPDVRNLALRLCVIGSTFPVDTQVLPLHRPPLQIVTPLGIVTALNAGEPMPLWTCWIDVARLILTEVERQMAEQRIPNLPEPQDFPGGPLIIADSTVQSPGPFVLTPAPDDVRVSGDFDITA